MSEPSFPSLKDHEGETIHIVSPFFDSTVIQTVRLIRMEDAGLWVENQDWNIEMLKKHFGVMSSPKTMIFFLPWHQISVIVGSLDVPSLSAESLGI